MAAKPETVFSVAVNRKLPATIYRMKNNNPFIGGIPDFWYSAVNDDLWVEYKYIPRIPQRGVVSPAKLLSALQTQWLNGRYTEGRKVAVIIGCPSGGVVLTERKWEQDLSAQQFNSLVFSKTQLAEWISSQVL